VSEWCQNFLELQDSDLDSLWWDRLGQAATLKGDEVAMSFFKRALEKEDATWICNYHLATCYAARNRNSEAIFEVKLALERAQSKDLSPTPTEEDMMMLHFALGTYHQANKELQQAAEQYLLVSKSKAKHWAGRAEVDYMIVGLRTDDVEGPKEMLQNLLAEEDGEKSVIRMLNIIARNHDHDFAISKILSIAKDTPGLLERVIAAIEKATTPDDDSSTEMSHDTISYASKESCGVLLYHRGMAVAYGLYPEGTGSVEKALTFWYQCREQLHAVGGSVASITRTKATNELAKYYFHSLMMEDGPPEHLEALSTIANEGARIEGGNATGYLAMLHVLRNDKEKARAQLLQRVKVGLQVLSDDDPDNDYFGYSVLFLSLAHYRDLRNSTAAQMFLGQPDLVTDSLHFELDDITDGDEDDKNKIMELANQLSKEISQMVKSEIPDPSQQIRRIQTAKVYVNIFLATSASQAQTSALNLLKTRISTLPELHASISVNAWSCDGTGPSGTYCDREAGLSRDLYQCMYCMTYAFCAACLKGLREGATPSMKCSAEHEWIKFPQQWSDFYCGLKAKNVRVPVVRSLEGDDRVFEAVFAEDGEGEVLTLEEWKAALAKEWDISLAG
jgi:tetratricopeptide (TPR) repeat protein